MGSKNISIKDEAYELLKSQKMENESFSDTIIRVFSQYGNLGDLVGKGKMSSDHYDEEKLQVRKQRDLFKRELNQ